MIQQGQVFKLKTKGADGQPLWAYRYRLEGRGSERPQMGGFANVRRRRRRCSMCSTGSGRAAGGRRSRSPSSCTSTWRCVRPSR